MSGTGTAAATSILLLGLVIGLILAQPSLERASEDLREARRESADMSLGLRNSGISITSSVHNNTTGILNTTIENTGSEPIEIDDIDLLVNGTMREWTSDGPDYLYPGREIVARTSNVTDPFSVMVIERYGISAHIEDVETVT